MATEDQFIRLLGDLRSLTSARTGIPPYPMSNHDVRRTIYKNAFPEMQGQGVCQIQWEPICDNNAAANVHTCACDWCVQCRGSRLYQVFTSAYARDRLHGDEFLYEYVSLTEFGWSRSCSERDNRSITILPAFLDVLQGLAQQINHIRIAMRWVRNGSWTFDDDVEHADKFKLAALFGVLQQYRVAAYLSFRFTSESKRKFILRGAELCNIHLRRQGPEFWCRPMNAEKLAILNIFQEDAKLNKLADEADAEDVQHPRDVDELPLMKVKVDFSV